MEEELSYTLDIEQSIIAEVGHEAFREFEKMMLQSEPVAEAIREAAVWLRAS